MTTKTKKFDCVEMKNRIQAEILAEYAAQSQHVSFAEFLHCVAKQSPFTAKMRERFGKPGDAVAPRGRGG